MPGFVSKIRVPVRVARALETPLDGVLCLSPSAAAHAGAQTILEYLNGPGRMMPVEPISSSGVRLVARLDIEWVSPNPGVDYHLIGPTTFRVTHQERVLVRLKSGDSLDGVIQMELPDGLNRVSDFLNGGDDFFPLATSLGVFLVNKHAVREVSLFEPSPLPITRER